jgi:meso-butanediol dehydrogenase/(S,S)-butanediol dehydrogenase/diacetyl reductase
MGSTDKRFSNKVCLVTGAARGIGAAIAAAFGAEGAQVVLTDILHDELDAQASQLGQTALPLDVADENGWRALAAEVDNRFGRLDVLVNNAGYGWSRPITEIALEDWRQLMSVNVEGMFLGMKHCIPMIAKSGGGAIVNLSSMYGTVGESGLSAYCASKGAVKMMSKAAAVECAELGNGIRVNSVHPGFVSTPAVAESLSIEDIDAMRLRHPMKRLADPLEIARAIVFLASDDASFVTGTELHVDGGFTAR